MLDLRLIGLTVGLGLKKDANSTSEQPSVFGSTRSRLGALLSLGTNTATVSLELSTHCTCESVPCFLSLALRSAKRQAAIFFLCFI